MEILMTADDIRKLANQEGYGPNGIDKVQRALRALADMVEATNALYQEDPTALSPNLDEAMARVAALKP